MILDVAEVEPDVPPWRDGVLLVAPLGESLDDICFAAQEAHEAHDFFAKTADLGEEDVEILDARDKNLVFYYFGFDLYIAEDRTEAVDDVIAVVGVRTCQFPLCFYFLL